MEILKLYVRFVAHYILTACPHLQVNLHRNHGTRCISQNKKNPQQNVFRFSVKAKYQSFKAPCQVRGICQVRGQNSTTINIERSKTFLFCIQLQNIIFQDKKKGLIQFQRNLITFRDRAKLFQFLAGKIFFQVKYIFLFFSGAFEGTSAKFLVFTDLLTVCRGQYGFFAAKIFWALFTVFRPLLRFLKMSCNSLSVALVVDLYQVLITLKVTNKKPRKSFPFRHFYFPSNFSKKCDTNLKITHLQSSMTDLQDLSYQQTQFLFTRKFNLNNLYTFRYTGTLPN